MSFYNWCNIKLYIEDGDRDNTEIEIKEFIEELSRAKDLKGIKLNEEIISLIKVEYNNLYKRIYGDLKEDEIKIVEGE